MDERPTKRPLQHYDSNQAADFSRQINGNIYGDVTFNQGLTIEEWRDLLQELLPPQQVDHSAFADQPSLKYGQSPPLPRNSRRQDFRGSTGNETQRRRAILGSLDVGLADDDTGLPPRTAARAFEWIFDTSYIFDHSAGADQTPSEGQAGPLSYWLARPFEIDMLWISGPPGSGKSTLLSYITQHPQTLRNLQSWANGRRIHMARHFFSYRGTAIQRSQEGLIRGLLHQLCTADPELLPLLCTRRWNSPLAAADQDWSLNELLSALHRIAKVPGACFCFFVDGLDEYEAMSGSETSEKALELLGEAVIELAKLPNVKICVSSRPYDIIKKGFAALHHLRLDNKTLYVPDELSGYHRPGGSDGSDVSSHNSAFLSDRQRREVLNRTIDLSQGNFTWVREVMAFVCQSAAEGATFQDLLDCLDDYSKLHQVPASPTAPAAIWNAQGESRNRSLDSRPDNLALDMLGLYPSSDTEAIVERCRIMSLWTDAHTVRRHILNVLRALPTENASCARQLEDIAIQCEGHQPFSHAHCCRPDADSARKGEVIMLIQAFARLELFNFTRHVLDHHPHLLLDSEFVNAFDLFHTEEGTAIENHFLEFLFELGLDGRTIYRRWIAAILEWEHWQDTRGIDVKTARRITKLARLMIENGAALNAFEIESRSGFGTSNGSFRKALFASLPPEATISLQRQLDECLTPERQDEIHAARVMLRNKTWTRVIGHDHDILQSIWSDRHGREVWTQWREAEVAAIPHTIPRNIEETLGKGRVDFRIWDQIRRKFVPYRLFTARQFDGIAMPVSPSCRHDLRANSFPNTTGADEGLPISLYNAFTAPWVQLGGYFRAGFG